uniref:Cytochrome b-c1 complex subunit 6 n=1 Tax=Strigamia maritima TaxID=126957 RepID=T1JJM0_STRMM
LVITIHDDEDIVDPQATLKEQCGEKKDCEAFKNKLDECEARVSGKASTTETCEEELFDFIHCVDHCVSHKLFDQLK